MTKVIPHHLDPLIKAMSSLFDAQGFLRTQDNLFSIRSLICQEFECALGFVHVLTAGLRKSKGIEEYLDQKMFWYDPETADPTCHAYTGPKKCSDNELPQWDQDVRFRLRSEL